MLGTTFYATGAPHALTPLGGRATGALLRPQEETRGKRKPWDTDNSLEPWFLEV